MTGPGHPPRWGVFGWAVALGTFAVGFWQLPLRAVGPDLDHLPGDVVDARLNNYILEHGYRYLTGEDPAFWDVGMYYPARRVVAYSDAHIGALPVYAAGRAVGLTAERAYQVWFLVPFGLNYASAAWAARRLGFGAVGAAASGYVFAFGLPLVTFLTLHSQLGPRFLVPPALVIGWRWLWEPTTWRLALLAACVVGQAYLTLYVGYFLVVVLTLQAAVTAVGYRRDVPSADLLRPGPVVWRGRTAVALAAVAAILPLLVPYARAAADHGTHGLAFNRQFQPRPASWLGPSEVSVHGRWLGRLIPPPEEGASEKKLFPGLVPIVAVVLGVRAFAGRQDPRGWAAVVGVAAATVLAGAVSVTCFGWFSAHDALSLVPGVGGMRATGRIALVLAFPLGLTVGAGLESAAARFGPAAGVALLGLLLADQATASPEAWGQARYPVAEAVERRERLAEVIRQHPRATLVYVFPRPGDEPIGMFRTQVDAIAAAQVVGVPTVNGWSGYTPPGWDFFTDRTGVWRWLTETNRVPEDMLAGLVFVGEPSSPGDPGLEGELARRYPSVGSTP